MSLTRLHLFSSLLAGLLLATSVSQPSHAELWTAKGTVTSVGVPWQSEIAVGADVFMQIEVDLNAIDQNLIDPTVGQYEYSDLVVLIVDNSVTHVSTGKLPPVIPQITVFDDVFVGPNFVDGLDVRGDVGFPTLTGVPFAGTFLSLEEQSATAPILVLPDDSLPLTLPPLASFTANRTLTSITFPGLETVYSADVTEFGITGSTPTLPVLPTSQTSNGGSIVWVFNSFISLPQCRASGCWIDPPISDSFSYEIVGAGMFKSIADFPTGFSQDFEVSVGATILGTFGPGDSVDFTTFPGGGVSSFKVANIDPGVDAENPTGFPLKIVIDSSVTQLTMTSAAPSPVPGFGSFGLALVGVLIVLSAVVVASRARIQVTKL